MSADSPPRRIITTLPFDLIPDQVADELVRNKNKRLHSSRARNIPFQYRSKDPQFDVLVHSFTGESSLTSFSDICIAGSHKHVAFFTVLQELDIHLNMQDLNQLIRELKQPNVSTLQARRIGIKLTPEIINQLPDAFKAFVMPVQFTSLIIMDTRLIRRPCYHVRSNTIRWNIRYSVGNTPRLRLTHFDHPAYAMNYERKDKMQVDWPVKLKLPVDFNKDLKQLLNERLNVFGAVAIPLSDDHIQPYIENISMYLQTLMNIPTSFKLNSLEFLPEMLKPENKHWRFRNNSVTMSKHIHEYTGETNYGSCSPHVKNLFHQIEMIVSHLPIENHNNNIFVHSPNIIVKF